MTATPPEVSVVIPVYNSATIFPVLYDRLVTSLTDCVKSFEVVAVIDGNADGSADVVEGITLQDSRVKMLVHARNFGHQAAVTTGLKHTTGDMVIIMDDDLEDPPEVLPAFIAKLRSGFDVVYGVRKKRKVPIHKRLSYFVYYRILNSLSNIDMPLDAGDFCIMRRNVVEQLNSMPERNRYVRGLRTWLGFRQVGMEYEREPRFAGTPGYNLSRYLQVGLDGILSFSYRPLVYVSALGALFSILSFAYATRLTVLVLIDQAADVPGWSSLMVATLFLGGVQLFSIGMIGQYIARIYDEVKARPHSVISRAVGFGDETKG